MLSKIKVKYIQSLCQKKQRDAENLFIAEGDKIISEVLSSNAGLLKALYATQKWYDEHFLLLQNIPVEIISEIELKQISTLQTPNQVLALLHHQSADTLPDPNKEWVLVLDALQDPGNMGTIMRTCDWFGIKHIVCSTTTVDRYNGKVIQASMGSFLRVRVHYTELSDYLQQNKTLYSYAAVLDGISYDKAIPSSHGLLLIGNEGKGIQNDLLPFIINKITIPSLGKAESLNASVAAGILLSRLTSSIKK
jgi:RNA methyltransferase, TrmH family